MWQEKRQGQRSLSLSLRRRRGLIHRERRRLVRRVLKSLTRDPQWLKAIRPLRRVALSRLVRRGCDHPHRCDLSG